MSRTPTPSLLHPLLHPLTSTRTHPPHLDTPHGMPADLFTKLLLSSSLSAHSWIEPSLIRHTRGRRVRYSTPLKLRLVRVLVVIGVVRCFCCWSGPQSATHPRTRRGHPGPRRASPRKAPAVPVIRSGSVRRFRYLGLLGCPELEHMLYYCAPAAGPWATPFALRAAGPLPLAQWPVGTSSAQWARAPLSAHGAASARVALAAGPDEVPTQAAH